MRGASFFNAARFPQAHYNATKFRKLGDNRYAADGTLSPARRQQAGDAALHVDARRAPVLAGKATVRRLDFGIGSGDWADTDLIPNDIAISTKVVLQPAQ